VTVMLHSGVCLQRQYTAFAGIARPEDAQVFREARQAPIRARIPLSTQSRTRLPSARQGPISRDRTDR
jgi:hypothetical protein